MKIIPAYPDLPALDAAGVKHEVDKPVEVEDAIARQLVRDGAARLPDGADPVPGLDPAPPVTVQKPTSSAKEKS